MLLTTVMEAGGAQKAMMQLGRGLAHRGWAVTVAAMYDKTGSIPGYEAEYGLEVIDLKMKPSGRRLKQALAMVAGSVRLWRLARARRVDVIQSFTHYSNILGPVVGVAAGVPVRVTSQRMSLEDRSGWFRWADRQVSRWRLARPMVAVSESVRRYCIDREGLAPDQVVVIPNGLDLDVWADRVEPADRARKRASLGLSEDHLMVTTVARLADQKGHAVLLEAIVRLRDRFPAVRFVWAGDGAARDTLVGKVRRLGLEEWVHMLGTRHDIPQLLHASDLFVLPSLWEGMPNAILEAMAAGLPVVATAVDGTPEVVAHGATGWLVPPGDPEALAAALAEALSDRGRRSALGAAGRQRVAERFTVEGYVSAFEALYGDLLGGVGSRA